MLKSRKSIKIGQKINDPSNMNVPGPGVKFFLFSLMRMRDMKINLGLKEVGSILLVKAVGMGFQDSIFLVLDHISRGSMTVIQERLLSREMPV